MIKGWTTDPNANEAYRPSKKIESTGIRKGPSSPEYHPEREQDAGEKESAGSESEEYRLRLIVLPGGKKEDTGTDGRTGERISGLVTIFCNSPFPSCCMPQFQSESWFTTIQLEMSCVFLFKSNSFPLQ